MNQKKKVLCSSCGSRLGLLAPHPFDVGERVVSQPLHCDDCSSRIAWFVETFIETGQVHAPVRTDEPGYVVSFCATHEIALAEPIAADEARKYIVATAHVSEYVFWLDCSGVDTHRQEEAVRSYIQAMRVAVSRTRSMVRQHAPGRRQRRTVMHMTAISAHPDCPGLWFIELACLDRDDRKSNLHRIHTMDIAHVNALSVLSPDDLSRFTPSIFEQRLQAIRLTGQQRGILAAAKKFTETSDD